MIKGTAASRWHWSHDSRLGATVHRIRSGSRLSSVTVDVFDTILLRTVWPEAVQFRTVARRWLDLLRSAIHPSLTEFEICSFREYARSVFWSARAAELRCSDGSTEDAEIRVDEWFDLLIRMLQSKYAVTLEDDRRVALVNDMIEVEIEVEIEHLRPNRRLVAFLEDLKRQTGLAIYYCSDNYLSREHIDHIMSEKNIRVFDGGVTSGDLRRGKYSGKLFQHLASGLLFPDFDPCSNLHIGDDVNADFLAAIKAGSHAHLYRTRHHRRRSWARRIGRRRQRRYVNAMRRSIGRKYAEHFRDRAVGVRVGSLFAPAGSSFAHQVSHRAQLLPGFRHVAVSSEANVIERLTAAVGAPLPDNLSFAPEINRRMILHALMNSVVRSGDEHQMKAVAKLMEHAEGLGDDLEALRFVGDDFGELIASKMDVDQRSSFVAKRLSEVVDDNSGNSWETLDKALGSPWGESLVLVDVGWLGTMQVMLRELMAVTRTSCEISGVYLGKRSVNPFGIDRGSMEGVIYANIDDEAARPLFVPEIWEYILSSSATSARLARSRFAHEGLYEGVRFWRSELHCSPGEFVEATSGALRRLLVRPRIDEILYLGTIEWTSGFTKETTTQLVDVSHNRFRKLVKGWVQPRKSVRDVTNLGPHRWPAAYVEFYRLGHLRPILRYLGKKRGVFYG